MNASSDDVDGQARVIAFVQALQELGWTDGLKSLARPEGNLTGINFYNSELVAKQLELLRELVPQAAAVAAFANPASTKTFEITLRDIEPAAQWRRSSGCAEAVQYSRRRLAMARSNGRRAISSRAGSRSDIKDQS